MRSSKLPRTIRGTVETGHSAPGETKVNKKDGSYKFIQYDNFIHPFMNYSITSHLDNRWTLGTSTGYMFDNAQSEVFFISYTLNDIKERKMISGVEEKRTVYARYIANGQTYYSEYKENGKSYGSLSKDLIRDNGSCFAFQHCENHTGTAIMCAKPVPFSTTEPISTLRLRIYIYAKHSNPEITKINNNNILIEDHGMYILFKPMVNNDLNRETPDSGKIEIGSDGDWLFIDIFNYDGEPTNFSESDPQRFCNGFICEISENPFKDEIIDAIPSDYYYLEQRRINYKRAGIELNTDYDPVSMGVRNMTINERQLPEPMLEVSDYGVGKLPWVNSSYPEPPPNFNWRNLIENRKMPY